MKKIAISTVLGSGLTASIFGLAAPAHAVAPVDASHDLPAVQGAKIGVDHLNWLDDVRQKVRVPRLGNTARPGR
jgi:hypothetical protein